MKSVHIRSYSGPYFPAFGLNTERYSVEMRKMRTRITPNTGTFYVVHGTKTCSELTIIHLQLDIKTPDQ